jgi:hypothetical protein
METLFETTHNLLEMLERFANSKESFLIRKRKAPAKKGKPLEVDPDNEPAVEDNYEEEEETVQKKVEKKFQFSSIEGVI